MKIGLGKHETSRNFIVLSFTKNNRLKLTWISAIELHHRSLKIISSGLYALDLYAYPEDYQKPSLILAKKWSKLHERLGSSAHAHNEHVARWGVVT